MLGMILSGEKHKKSFLRRRGGKDGIFLQNNGFSTFFTPPQSLTLVFSLYFLY